jgi:hypothetical protein
MGKHRSFVPSDFLLRNTPRFLIGYLVISLICIVLGLLLQALPVFWRGLLCGVGLGLFGALALLRHRREIDVAALPKPSDNVRAKCDDPNCPLAEAVKTCCDETELSLTEGTTLLKAYLAKRQEETFGSNMHE